MKHDLLYLLGSCRVCSALGRVAHIRIVLFMAVPAVVCHVLLDSSLGKLAYTSRSVVVSFYTVYT